MIYHVVLLHWEMGYPVSTPEQQHIDLKEWGKEEEVHSHSAE